LSLKDITDVFQILASIAVLATAFFASYQLILIRKAHQDDHEWNRRKSAQDLTMELTESLGDTAILHERLQIINRKEPIPLDEILKAIKEDPVLQLKIQKVLNIYSVVASGVLNGVYDKEIIEKARRKAMIATYDAFSAYITYRRKESIPTLWFSLESIVNGWKNELTSSETRELIGNKT